MKVGYSRGGRNCAILENQLDRILRSGSSGAAATARYERRRVRAGLTLNGPASNLKMKRRIRADARIRIQNVGFCRSSVADASPPNP
jgi:hypothetical protein